MLRGVNYERLEGYKSLQWPFADGTDQHCVYTKNLIFRTEGAALPVSWSGPVEKSNQNSTWI